VIGVIKFHETAEGVEAVKLINDGCRFDIATAYTTDSIEIFDADNRLVDPADSRRAHESGIAFEIAEWQIAAIGLFRNRGPVEDRDRAYHGPVEPAVAESFARMAAANMAMIEANSDQRLASRAVKPQINVSIFDGIRPEYRRNAVEVIRARVRAAQALIQSEQLDTGWRDVIMPPDLIYFGKPERM
jgi:hypothetical protein